MQRYRARQRGVPHELTSAQIAKLYADADGAECPGCGHVMEFGGNLLNVPTLDRVRNDIGYRMSNVVVLCWKCNSTKSDMTGEQLMRLADYVMACEELAS